MKGKGAIKAKARKTFKKGDQCVQNPTTKKFRNDTKRNIISQRKNGGGLTVAALQKHNEDVDDDLHMEDLAISETTGVTKKSKAFSISGLTDCSNITFNRVLDKWNSTDLLDQEKCAVLAAVTEVIRSKGGNESETDYFAALMSLLESITEEGSCAAILYLISLVVKKVPSSVLKMKCSECLKCFSQLLEVHHESGRASLLMSILECLSTILTAQEPAIWTEASTQRSFQMMLSFVTHSKPRVRKVAHTSIQSILKFALLNHKNHPAGSATAKHVLQILSQYTADTSALSQHALNLLRNCLHFFGVQQLKELCESILQMLSINNPMIKANVMEIIHTMFKSNPPEENLPVDLNVKLIAALYDFQPSYNDVHVAEAWLAVELEAHSNLALLNNEVCLKHLPKFFGTALSFFQSEQRHVVHAAANKMKEASEKCMEPYIQTLEVDVESADSSFVKIFKLIESGLRYKFQPVWHVVLQSMQYLYTTYGKIFPTVMVKSVSNLAAMYSGPTVPFLGDLKKAIGAAFTSIGPKLVLAEIPLELMKHSPECQFPRGWLLPIMKDHIKETELQYFIDEFLPILSYLRHKGTECRANKQDLEAKVYETLSIQVWSLLTGFCKSPTDVTTSFKNIAKILGTALMEEKAIRSLVLTALRTLINTTEEADLKCIGQFSKNFLPIFFNLYTSDDDDCKAISLQVLEVVRAFLMITDEKLTMMFLDRSLDKLKEEDSRLKRHQLLDLVVSMVKYCDDEHLEKLYQLSFDNVKNHKDKSTQKKAYRILEEICDGNSDSCKKLIAEKFDQIKVMLGDSLSTAVPSSKAPRLRCLSYLVKKLTKEQSGFIKEILPEVILCTKELGAKAKCAAFDLIGDIGTAIVFLSDRSKEECVEEYFTMVMAGLAGSPLMISGTLLAFTKMAFEYKYCLSDKIIGSLLDTAIMLLRSRTNEVVKASLIFIRAVVKILDAKELSGHLETLIKNLFNWSATSKSANRQKIRIILERLDRKCGYELVRKFVPEDHRRFIVQIHKQLMRNKRQKDEAKENYERVKEEKKEANTWEDILADSGDEEDEDDPIKKRLEKRKQKQSKTWIMENEEAVDLMDPKVAQNIVGTRPKLQAKKRGDPSQGFEMSSDGKLMIDNKNDDENVGEKPLDIGEKDMLAGFDRIPKQMKAGKRKLLEEMPEETFEYQPGGKGIHRDRGEMMAGTADGDDEQPQRKRKFGDEYKAKKAGGDMKLKGKPDPFAYIPLDRQKLNKRKRAKLTGQFNSMVKATKRGASKANSKGHKKHKK